MWATPVLDLILVTIWKTKCYIGFIKNFFLVPVASVNWLLFWMLTDAYPAHSGESFCSSDISLDDSTNLDEGGSDTLSLELGPSHDWAQVNVNPIDKLYLMQNSYFSTTEQWATQQQHRPEVEGLSLKPRLSSQNINLAEKLYFTSQNYYFNLTE